jgi:steroid 5-alpha reductase family enzyme
MWKTVLLLLLTIIIIPFFAFRIDVPLTEIQGAALKDLLVVYIISAGCCFILSILSRNYSQVDKLWSLIPIAYVWIIAFQSGFEGRIVLMAVLVTAWGFRLTYNFSRRGGYSIKFWTGEEDYRWAVLRAKPEFSAKWKWFLFNMLFISFYQMGLILLITLPALRSMQGSAMTWFDLALSIMFILFVVLETIADQQQWNFHKQKNKLIEAGEELPEKYKKGFISSGLWGITRHPNYAAEQAIWIVFYFFSVSATGMWLNWSVMGAILLVLLFWGSSNFSESISASKYPDYHDYRKRVARFVPIRFK